MKILQIFGAVVAIHLLAFIFIFASPGCQTGPREIPTPDATLGTTTAGPSGPVAAPVDYGTANVSYAPVTDPGRAAPTRPGSPNAIAITPAKIAPAEVAPVTMYTVERGDSLWSIAKKNQLSVAELAKANNLTTSTVLQPGRKLIIPGKLAAAPADLATAPAGATYTVLPGDTLATIARKHDTSTAALRAANNRTGDIVRIGEQLVLPADAKPATTFAEPGVTRSADATVHVVQSGEKLGIIARKYGLTVAELATANNISDPSRIRAGQQLNIPGAKAGAAKATAVRPATPEPLRAVDANAPIPTAKPAADHTPHFEIHAPPPGVDLDAGLKDATTEVPTIKVEETAPPKN